MKNPMSDYNYPIGSTSQCPTTLQSSTPIQIIDKILAAIPNAIAAPFIELRKLEMMERRMEAYYELCKAAHAAIHQTLHDLAMSGQLTAELRLFYYQLLQCYPI